MNLRKSIKPIRVMSSILSARQLKSYAPKLPVYLEKKKYIIKTADNFQELKQALKLRHDVFYEELLHKRRKSGLEMDRFDLRCDHLLVLEKSSGKIIGTYRLQSSLHSKHWYTATEFRMKQIQNLPGNKLELGRACVHRDFRTGLVISLLWEGIHAYMQASNTKYMFGCSSVKTTNKEEISRIYAYLKQQNHISDEHNVRPKGRFKLIDLPLSDNPASDQCGGTEKWIEEGKIPPLLMSYLNAGAKVCGKPALDKNFRCVDFLTLLEVSGLRERYDRKFRSPSTVGTNSDSPINILN